MLQGGVQHDIIILYSSYVIIFKWLLILIGLSSVQILLEGCEIIVWIIAILHTCIRDDMNTFMRIVTFFAMEILGFGRNDFYFVATCGYIASLTWLITHITRKIFWFTIQVGHSCNYCIIDLLLILVTLVLNGQSLLHSDIVSLQRTLSLLVKNNITNKILFLEDMIYMRVMHTIFSMMSFGKGFKMIIT